MKQKFTIFFAIFTILVLTNFSFSQTYLVENFDYPTGDSLGAHGWNWISGTTNILSATSPGMVYAGYPLSNIGNATTLATSGEDSYKELGVADSVGSIYATFMVNITAAQRQGDYFAAFLQTGSTTFYEGRLSARIVDGVVNFGITKGNSASDTTVAGIWTTGNYALNTTYLVVLKYTFIAGTANDAVSLFVFSSGVPATEPTPTVGPISAYTSADASSIGRFALRQGTATRAPNVNLDGIKVTKSWSDILLSVQNVSNNISQSFELSQNYPNPFNPSTTINFNIPSNGFVTLNVYDALGKEVGNLVNENLNAGSYKYNFNGSNLNSGIYFYTMKYTNNSSQTFTQTKKLILVK
ncbi:MAG TPA: T9SS type A sorting domain-containing protein [Ignavibacteria bacterium]|nr:T9SS type A sorting domain-containing protein [Ignavibacteria bacterium]